NATYQQLDSGAMFILLRMRAPSCDRVTFPAAKKLKPIAGPLSGTGGPFSRSALRENPVRQDATGIKVVKQAQPNCLGAEIETMTAAQSAQIKEEARALAAAHTSQAEADPVTVAGGSVDRR